MPFISQAALQQIQDLHQYIQNVGYSYKRDFGQEYGYDSDLHDINGDCEHKQLRLALRAVKASTNQLQRLVENPLAQPGIAPNRKPTGIIRARRARIQA